MEVTLHGVMGGPETGVRYLAAIVGCRPRLKAALAPLAVSGLATLDLSLWIGGSVTDHGQHGFEAKGRYQAARGQLDLVIAVPRHEAETTAGDAEPDAVLDWIRRGLAQPTLSAAARKLDLGAVSEALARAR